MAMGARACPWPLRQSMHDDPGPCKRSWNISNAQRTQKLQAPFTVPRRLPQLLLLLRSQIFPLLTLGLGLHLREGIDRQVACARKSQVEEDRNVHSL